MKKLGKRWLVGLGVIINCSYMAGDAWAIPLDRAVTSAMGMIASLTESPKVSGVGLLGGSFVQPTLLESWSRDDFSTKFSALKIQGMNHIIWQWTVDSKRKQAYYPTALPGFSQKSSMDMVGISLEEAQKKGLKIWLGLNWNEDWFKNYGNDEKWLSVEVELSKKNARELWQLYGSRYANTIAGFYLPMEMDNLHFQDKKIQARMARAYCEIGDEIHHLTVKKVMVAPFFNQSLGQDHQAYAAMWGNILQVAPIDVLALQDGIGCNHGELATIGQWLGSLGTKIKEVRPSTQLWSDVETFMPDYTPAPLDRVVRQIDAEEAYVSAFTSFSFVHYNLPNQRQGQLFYQQED